MYDEKRELSPYSLTLCEREKITRRKIKYKKGVVKLS